MRSLEGHYHNHTHRSQPQTRDFCRLSWSSPHLTCKQAQSHSPPAPRPTSCGPEGSLGEGISSRGD